MFLLSLPVFYYPSHHNLKMRGILSLSLMVLKLLHQCVNPLTITSPQKSLRELSEYICGDATAPFSEAAS